MSRKIRTTHISFHTNGLSSLVLKHHHLYSVTQNTPLKLRKLKFLIIPLKINLVISVGLYYRF